MAILTGGTWDSTQGPLFFIASNPRQIDLAELNRDILIAVNELSDKTVLLLDKWIAAGRNVFVDSGIFNLTNQHMRAHGCSMDDALSLPPDEIDGFQDLWDHYLKIITRVGSKCWGYIELDQGGRENKIKTRAKLEKLGFNPIPVYHPINDGWDYFDYLAERYDRICVGNLVQANQAVRVRLLATIAVRRKKYPGLWIHALGVAPIPFLNAVGTDSADASTWLWPVRWGRHPASALLTRAGWLPELFQYRYDAVNTDPTGEEGLTRILGADVHWASSIWRSSTLRKAREFSS